MAASYTRKQVVTCVSIVYLVFTTALAAYASSRATGLSIPIPRILSGFATALPLVAGLLLEGGYDLNRRQERRQRAPKGTTPRPPLVIVANTLIFIYSTVVITLLGTHVAPVSNLRCGLDEGWKHMFSTKDTAIKDIQDALNCCGLVNSHDRAWPFPDKTHDQHACEKQFERTTGCLVPWRQEEQRVAGILMAVVGMVFVWQFAIIATPTRRESWLHQALPNRVSSLIADENGGPDAPRRAIDYLPRAHYRDAEQVDDEEAITPRQRVIEESGDHVQGLQQTTLDNAWARN